MKKKASTKSTKSMRKASVMTLERPSTKKRRPSKDFVLKNLKEGIVMVNFDKVDGTSRTMKATLNFDLIPKAYWPNKGQRNYNETNEHNECRCFDIDLQDWRAFRYDRLNEAKPLESSKR